MIFWAALYPDTCIVRLNLCVVAGKLSKVKVVIHPGFSSMHFSTQKPCLGRFWKFVVFLDMADQSHLPDSRSNSWPVQKPQAQCQYLHSPPMQHLHGRINTCRKLQHWFAQSYTSCVHTVSSRCRSTSRKVQAEARQPVKSTGSMLTVQRSLKGMPSSNVLSSFHCVFQLMMSAFSSDIHSLEKSQLSKHICLTIGEVLKLSYRAVLH